MPKTIKELEKQFRERGYSGTTAENQDFIFALLEKIFSLEKRIMELEKK